jgi:hypothetical protein
MLVFVFFLYQASFEAIEEVHYFLFINAILVLVAPSTDEIIDGDFKVEIPKCIIW